MQELIYLPERQKFELPLPKILPVASIQATVAHFVAEISLKGTSLQTKNSRWNTLVAYAAERGLLYSSWFPEDLLLYAHWLSEGSHAVKKVDDYISTARQRLLLMRRMAVDQGSKEAYDEVLKNRIKLSQKNYSPSSAAPLSKGQITTFRFTYPALAPIVDLWLFTGFRISSLTTNSLEFNISHTSTWSFLSTSSKSQHGDTCRDWRCIPTDIAIAAKNRLPMPRWQLEDLVVKRLGGHSHAFRRTVAIAIRRRADAMGVKIPSIQERINKVLGWSADHDKSFLHYTRDSLNFAGRILPVDERLLEFVFRHARLHADSKKSKSKNVVKQR